MADSMIFFGELGTAFFDFVAHPIVILSVLHLMIPGTVPDNLAACTSGEFKTWLGTETAVVP